MEVPIVKTTSFLLSRRWKDSCRELMIGARVGTEVSESACSSSYAPTSAASSAVPSTTFCLLWIVLFLLLALFDRPLRDFRRWDALLLFDRALRLIVPFLLRLLLLPVRQRCPADLSLGILYRTL